MKNPFEIAKSAMVQNLKSDIHSAMLEMNGEQIDLSKYHFSDDDFVSDVLTWFETAIEEFKFPTESEIQLAILDTAHFYNIEI